MCVLLCRAPVPSRDVAQDQMKAVYLPSPEPIIFHSRLMGEIIRHVQFLSADRELPLPADTPSKYSSLASLANANTPHPPPPLVLASLELARYACAILRSLGPKSCVP